MLTLKELNTIKHVRMNDAKSLLLNRRYSGAVYLCGYALEIALKTRICKTLKWPGFPNTNAEFRDLTNFKIHNLDVLLKLSGKETYIKTNFLSDWSIVNKWDPESRYSIKPVNKSDARVMITSTETLLRIL